MGPRAGLDGCGNPEFDSRTVQPVVSCYTNYAIPSHRIGKLISHIEGHPARTINLCDY